MNYLSTTHTYSHDIKSAAAYTNDNKYSNIVFHHQPTNQPTVAVQYSIRMTMSPTPQPLVPVVGVTCSK